MDNRTRNRWIGIIAILLIIIIFFPYEGNRNAIHKEKEISLTALSTAYDDFPSEIADPADPVEPHVNSLPSKDRMITPSKSLPAATSHPPKKELSQMKPIPKIVTPEKEKLTVKGHLEEVKNYAIQLVALKNQKKIEELLALLRLHNYHAYVDKGDEEKIQRLFVGPYSSKEQAESTILDLHNLTKLKGIIITK